MIKFLGLLVLAGVAAVVGVPLSPGQSPQDASNMDQQQQILREKRSSFQQAYYAPPPCASAHHIPAPYLAHHAAYGPAIPAIPPIPHYGYGLPLPHYRDADEQEMMHFSDMDPEQMMMTQQFVSEMEHPMARYAYGAPALPVPALAPAASAHIPAIAAAPGAPGPAIGIFPGGSTGGCSVPLLLTCSPSIRPGHIVPAQPASYGEAYRGVDESFHEGSFHEGQELTHEQMSQSLVSPHDAPSPIQRHQ